MGENGNSIIEDINDDINKTKSSANLFSILGIHTKELIHSRFLAYLLANNGKVFYGNSENDCLDIKHKYGTQFLKNFLTIFYGTPYFKSKLKKSYDINIYNLDFAKVFVEYEDKDLEGRIDILIKINDSYWIAIENKIYASDQEEQLVRYHSFLKSKIKDNKFDLIYLTLDGHTPSKKSVGKLSKDVDYCIMSYDKVIKDWIEDNLKTVEPNDPIKEFVGQYKNALEILLAKQLLSMKLLKLYEKTQKEDLKFKEEFKKIFDDLCNDKKCNEEIQSYKKDLLLNYFYPYLIKEKIELGERDDYSNEGNIIYYWQDYKKSKRYDFYILFEFTETLEVVYYPALHDRSSGTKGKWYCVNKAEEKWIGWQTDKNNFCNEKIDVDEFINKFKKFETGKESSIIDMKKLKDDLQLPKPIHKRQ